MQSERCVNSAHQAISSNLSLVMGLAIAVGFSFPSEAAEFSNTELQLQYGRLKVPKFAGGGEDNTTILPCKTPVAIDGAISTDSWIF